MILVILGILVSVFAAIKPGKIGPIPLNMVTVPLLVLGALLLTGIVDPSAVITGIIGVDTIRPWEIIIVFFTVAYVSISVDLSGILDYFAFRIVKRAGGSTKALFWFFYAFASVLTIFTSNDIVILTLTPIIFYLKKHADIDVIPLLFAEFFGANTLSMLLYIGNPTNIIIGNAVGLGFAEYTRIMALPTLVAGLVNGLMLFLLFRGALQKHGGRFLIHEDSTVALRSMYDAVASTVLLLVMLVLLFLSEDLHIPIWWITLGFSLIFFLEDLIISLTFIARNPRLYLTEISSDMKKIYALYGFACNRYDIFVIARRIPWKILPFLIVVFVLVYALVEKGFIAMVADFLARLSINNSLAVLVNGVVAFFLSNVINNQPAAIVYSNILVDPGFAAMVGPKAAKGAAYAAIAATNLGANLTLIGALAGIMWEKILAGKGIAISYGNFLKVGLLITPLAFALTLACIMLVL